LWIPGEVGCHLQEGVPPWCKRGVVRKDWTRSKVEGATQRIGPLRKNLQMQHEGRRGTKDVGSKWLLYLKKKRATAIGTGGC
jgi:hypothetical protein